MKADTSTTRYANQSMVAVLNKRQLILVTDLDKSEWDAKTSDIWEFALDNYEVYGIFNHGQLVSLLAGVINASRFDVFRVVTAAPFRKRGYSRELFEHVAKLHPGIPLQMSIPEHRIGTMDSDDLKGWLNKLGFTYLKTIKDDCEAYGKKWDYFVFTTKKR